MNKKELEKMFDEQDFNIYDEFENEDWDIEQCISDEKDMQKIKDFIFNEIIPEVLNSVVINNEWKLINIDAIVNIKQKAEDLYNITF